MFSDIVSGFAREYVQVGEWLPKAVRPLFGIAFAISAVVFHEAVAAGVLAATNEMTARWMETLHPVIANFANASSVAPTS